MKKKTLSILKKVAKRCFPSTYFFLKRLIRSNQSISHIYPEMREVLFDALLTGKGKKLGRNRILLIGREGLGDSIGMHSKAFLECINNKEHDLFFYDEYSHNLYFYTGVRKERNFVLNCFAPKIDGTFFDMMFFVNVLDSCKDEYPFAERVPRKKSLISFAYPVFDGTKPPLEWIKAINSYFDGILVTCANQKRIFESSDILTPVFELPLALDLSLYCCAKHSDDTDQILKDTCQKPFTFGWIGTFEDRKNPLKLVEAFQKAFGNRKDVLLKMHTRYVDMGTDSGKQFNDLLKENFPNIKITHDVLNEEEVAELLKSFDVYVYVSRGEGYSITPRQALASGIPVILSAIPTHRDITNLGAEDGVFWVCAEIEIPAVQPSLNNKICGTMYDITVDDLKKVMLEVYADRYHINTPEKIRLREREGMRYSIDSLRELYNTITSPEDVKNDAINEIKHNEIFTDSPDLFEKYNYYMTTSRTYTFVLPGHDGGFCSNFNKWISHLAYTSDNVKIVPDWRVKTIRGINYSIHGSLNLKSFCYGTEADANIFLRCFENPYQSDGSDSLNMDSVMMYHDIDMIMDWSDFNVTNEPNLSYINSYNLYNDDLYFQEFRKKYHDVYKKYCKLRPEIQKKIDIYKENNLSDKFVISALIRSPTGHAELIRGDNPTNELYEKNINQILKKEGIERDSDRWRLFIAADNEEIIMHFNRIYHDRVLYQNIKRQTKEDLEKYLEIRKKLNKNVEGYGIQHEYAKNRANWSLRNAHEILFDINILAAGNYFIFINSNISTMVSYLNPDIKMVYCK